MYTKYIKCKVNIGVYEVLKYLKSKVQEGDELYEVFMHYMNWITLMVNNREYSMILFYNNIRYIYTYKYANINGHKSVAEPPNDPFPAFECPHSVFDARRFTAYKSNSLPHRLMH